MRRRSTLALAADYVMRGATSSGATFALFAVAILLAPLLGGERACLCPRPDALGLVLGASQALLGLEFLLERQGTPPAGLGLPPTLVGSALLGGGVAVLLTQLVPTAPSSARWAAHLFGGGVLLWLWTALALHIDSVYWTLGAAVVVRGVATAVLPWWSERAAMLDRRALRARLAVALVTATVLPLLVALPPVLDSVAGTEVARARQTAFNVTVVVGFVAAAAGWWLAGWITAPITALVQAVDRAAAGGAMAPPLGGSIKVLRLSTAVQSMAVNLQAQAAERVVLYEAERAARDQAEGAVLLRNQVLATVTHDLKNPLAAIMGSAQLIRRQARRTGDTVPSFVDTGLGRIEQATAKMQAMVDELLDTARLHEGAALELSAQPTDLVALVRACVASHQERTERHRITVAACDEPLVGMWDRQRLERVVDNLLSNAVKYSPAGGTISVTVRRDAADRSWARLDVVDQGMGIPAVDLPHVFERYHRGSNVGATISGAGIGLAGARQIVEQHGGVITVTSVEGKGSAFAVHVPLES
ncbi:MAG: HAMP domain-containing sensor histidine kinase [Dehalococcoidia bacterium]